MATGEFAQAVRRWRDRVAPQAAGLPAGGRRRAPGLRREELAQLAGISADYITRLEQGRATHPSAQVVEALARSLRLAPEERAHLYRAAGLIPPGPGTVPGWIPPSVQRLLDRLAGVPVAVFDALWTLLLANGPYEALMGDSSALGSRERNAVWRTFLGSGSRAVMTPAERAAFEAGMAADLRTVAQRYPDDPRPAALVAALRAGSPRFAELWDEGTVGAHLSTRKIIAHPHVGEIRLDCDVLTVHDSDLRIMVYTAEPGTTDAERLALAGVLGNQDLGTGTRGGTAPGASG
ncbi:helix-turn-helix transcriptional regulator [Streptomyces sp. NRRL F-5630]|uniref:helix-turn-helix transcriptional regulator n=1 Tax=Streptomyces sp. NRRL F-5630 TaxID=1463864 RepID=UPI000AF2506A